ncbi:MAG TPA: hypothetical protein VGD31_00775 [Sphingobacteriaceae bacterium]
MLAINNDKFNRIVSDAIENVAVTVNNERLAKRWINAIEKAVDLVENQSEFITWNEADKSVLVWSQETNRIYEANGVCQCKAFAEGQPCKHRALARLVKTYYGTESKIENAPYLPAMSQAKPLAVGRYKI